ncbi:MAG TPA: urea ABC transporter permease subunit UrtC [Aggregatilineales bacterium]|nr:urea ABC transporter permease subunit UrtC [Aggregatilineales bacterium]
MTKSGTFSMNQRWGYWSGFILAGVLILIILPQILSPFQVNLLGKFLTFAIVAIGLDLLWGYTGMLSLGQGLFFGLGGYCFGMYLNLETVGDRLPDFMSLYGVFELPTMWEPFHSPVFALGAAILVPMIIAAVLGAMVFTSRIQGVYFAIITQALTAIVALLLINQQKLINGTNGITEMKTIFGYGLAEQSTQLALYLVTAVVLGVVFLLAFWLTHSRFGKVMVAIRDDENRVRFVGYNPVIIKTAVFALSAGISGLAGALFVPQVGIISPQQLGIVASIEIVIWVAVGGRGTLVGAVLGALLVNTGKSTISTEYPEIWQFFMGGLFIGVVLIMPKGIVGTSSDLIERIQKRTGQIFSSGQGDKSVRPGAEADNAV